MQNFHCVIVAITLAIILALNTGVALSSSSNNTVEVTPGANNNSSKLKVVASFFPIYEFVKKVGGEKVDSSVLIPVGAEPHDFDPTIQQIQNTQSAAAVVYNGAGMEATWINKINPKFAIDTSKGLNLLSTKDPEIHASTNPHIWLDPILVIHQVENIRDGLIKVDPNNAMYYKNNAQNFIGQLKSLDTAIRGNLSSSNCAKRDFIAFHNAFSYFAKEYGLNQHSIQGLTPEGEILPQRLVEVVQLANKIGINVIYSEDLVDPRSAQAIAAEIPNGKVMVLSPIEGIKSQEQQQGIDYLTKDVSRLICFKARPTM